jgi:hypothetical protein
MKPPMSKSTVRNPTLNIVALLLIIGGGGNFNTSPASFNELNKLD